MILIADVDDTICDSTKPISDSMVKIIESLSAASNPIVFISGSTVYQIYEQLKPLKCAYYLLGTSGTRCRYVDSNGFKDIYANVMSVEHRKLIIAAFEKIMLTHSIPAVKDQIQDRESQVTLSILGRNADSELKKAYDPTGAKRIVMTNELRSIIGNSFNVVVGGSTSIDVTPAGIDKGWGVDNFLKFKNWKPSDCMFFGDKLMEGGNDWPVKRIISKCIEVKEPANTLKLLSEML